MTIKNTKYKTTALLCIACIEDIELRKLIESDGSLQVCVLCDEENICVSIKELAEIIDPYIRQHFCPGEFERRWEEGDSDGYWEEQQGEDLSSVLQNLLGHYLDCEDALIDALIDGDPYDPRSGEDSFYDRSINYQEIPVSVYGIQSNWDAICDELKSRRRFFSDEVRKFFDWLFEDVDKLRFYAKPDAVDFSEKGSRGNLKQLGVIHEFPIGTTIFRGRRGSTVEDYNRIILAPEVELAPPPSSLAKVGRMNPEGVTIFYGALDEDSCVAELRPSIGSYIVVGRFETTKVLQLLDFGRLDQAHWDGKGLSYFQNDFERMVARRKFRRRLHRLISQPVVTGHESDYLITQVLAEYLAHVRKESFDGLLFTSTQKQEGTNIVLFPKRKTWDEDGVLAWDKGGILDQLSLKYVADSAQLYEALKIEYATHKIDFYVIENAVNRYHDYDDDDYGNGDT